MQRSSRGGDNRINPRTAERIADVMFALSSPSRVEILGCLLSGPHSVGQMVELIGVEQSALSHQLRVLRDHDLVRADRRGRQRLYELRDEHVAALLEDAIRHVERHGAQAGRDAV